jgi:hypothetical protein
MTHKTLALSPEAVTTLIEMVDNRLLWYKDMLGSDDTDVTKRGSLEQKVEKFERIRAELVGDENV